MGILNITPDSFSDGGAFLKLSQAQARANYMVEHGADLIDIGGESTRPGAEPVGVQAELDRVIPIIEAIRKECDICISIDTSKPEVMDAAVSAGAGLINDVRALSREEAILIAVKLKVPVILMHMQGTPESMQAAFNYTTSVIEEINHFFKQQVQRCQNYGLEKNNILLDPGFGFGKSLIHNLQIMKYFSTFKYHKMPLVLGVSRKSSLGLLLNKPINERLIGGVALSVMAAMDGVAILRTHDVDETKQALQVVEAVKLKGSM